MKFAELEAEKTKGALVEMDVNNERKLLRWLNPGGTWPLWYKTGPKYIE